MTTAACGNNVFRTSARILVPVNDMNPMAIADSGATHVIIARVLCSTPNQPSQSIADLQLAKSRQSKHIGRSLLNMSLSLYAH